MLIGPQVIAHVWYGIRLPPVVFEVVLLLLLPLACGCCCCADCACRLLLSKFSSTPSTKWCRTQRLFTHLYVHERSMGLIGVSVIRALLLSPDARPARLPPVTMCVLKLPSGNEEDGLDDSDVLSLQ
uniref:Putative secreted protein n=1 Tax=Anopheles marajoara TaxID=58244 RepID=A0A2M4C6V8_9DIPT